MEEDLIMSDDDYKSKQYEVETETLYREVYWMTQEQFDNKAFDEAEVIITEAIDIPTIVSSKEV